MSTNLKLSRRIASGLLLSVALVGCASGPKSPAPDLLQRVESAQTREDHEGLATYYDQEAVKARKFADEHRKMSKSYQAGAAGGRGGASMASHCNAIVQSQETIAAEYEAMAVGHRQMAAMAKP